MCECMQLYAESKFEKKKVTVCNECRAWQVLHDYPSSSRSVMLDVARMVEKLLWAHQIDKRKGSLTWPYNAHPAPMGASHAPRSCSTSCLRLTSWLSAHAVGWIILLKKHIFSFHGNDIPFSLEYNHYLILQLSGWGLCGFGWRVVRWPLCCLISVLWHGVIVGEGQADRQVWKAAGRQNRKVPD